jgi:branched-subunit amino acid transport protein
MDQTTVLLTILGMGVVTYLLRLLPLLILARRRPARRSTMPPWVEAWLRHVPAAVLAAMLFPSLWVAEGQAKLSPNTLYLWAAIPTLAIAWKTRSLFGAVLAGMAVVALGRLLSG